jgi:hypothetical protein
MKTFPIIDADGHVTESLESLRKHLGQEHQNRPLFTSEAWDRSFGGTLGKRNEDPKVQLADMDLDGIDIQVVFPQLRKGDCSGHRYCARLQRLAGRFLLC